MTLLSSVTISHSFKSKAGWFFAGAYLLLAAIVFRAHLYSVKTNAADSGESAIPFIMLTLPWIMLLPKTLYGWPAWAYPAYPAARLLILFNAFPIYLPFGLRFKRHAA